MIHYLSKSHTANAFRVFNSGNPVLGIIYAAQEMRHMVEEETP